jgi:hypothetical protein
MEVWDCVRDLVGVCVCARAHARVYLWTMIGLCREVQGYGRVPICVCVYEYVC